MNDFLERITKSILMPLRAIAKLNRDFLESEIKYHAKGPRVWRALLAGTLGPEVTKLAKRAARERSRRKQRNAVRRLNRALRAIPRISDQTRAFREMVVKDALYERKCKRELRLYTDRLCGVATGSKADIPPLVRGLLGITA